MNEISGRYEIIKNNLNNTYYLKSLLKEGYEVNAFEDDQVEKIQMSLLSILTKQVSRYTSNESSSVRTETAQRIFESICYCIGVYLKTIPEVDRQIELLKTESTESLFIKGTEKVKEYIADGGEQLKNLQEKALKINNLAYINTLSQGIPEFFRDYDLKYGAQEGGGSIDYPLSMDIVDLAGIEYMKEYLARFTLENDFCRRFPEKYISQLLAGYHEDYSDYLINIYEIILTNALGLGLLDEDFYRLDINEGDQNTLKKMLSGKDASRLQGILSDAAEKLHSKMEFDDADLLAYMKRTAVTLSQRLFHVLAMEKLEMLFLSFKREEKKEASYYQDGQMMEDEKLRQLIEEMQDCRYTTDKIAMVKRHIHSLGDLAEVLDICFFGDELTEVFQLLNKSEITALFNYLDNEDEKDWQKALKEYAANL